MAVLGVMQNAMLQAVALINDVGTSCIYTPKATGVPVNLKIMTRELGNLELVGDFRQGDMRVELDALALPAKPAKYDTLEIDGLKYSVVSPAAAPRRVGDTIYTYKFVIRGG